MKRFAFLVVFMAFPACAIKSTNQTQNVLPSARDWYALTDSLRHDKGITMPEGVLLAEGFYGSHGGSCLHYSLKPDEQTFTYKSYYDVCFLEGDGDTGMFKRIRIIDLRINYPRRVLAVLNQREQNCDMHLNRGFLSGDEPSDNFELFTGMCGSGSWMDWFDDDELNDIWFGFHQRYQEVYIW